MSLAKDNECRNRSYPRMNYRALKVKGVQARDSN